MDAGRPVEGAIALWEIEMRVSSDAKPGMRMLWLRSISGEVVRFFLLFYFKGRGGGRWLTEVELEVSDF